MKKAVENYVKSQENKITANETVRQVQNPPNTRILKEKEFRISNKPILELKYKDLIEFWGKPNEIRKVKVYFPATETPDYSYILKYDGIDIEMYPAEINVSVEDTESFRFESTSSKYDFYGVKVGMSLDDYLNTVENKNVFSGGIIMLGHLGFSYIGLIYLLMLWIPNTIWSKNKPIDYNATQENKILLVFERVGQVCCTCSILIFSRSTS